MQENTTKRVFVETKEELYSFFLTNRNVRNMMLNSTENTKLVFSFTKNNEEIELNLSRKDDYLILKLFDLAAFMERGAREFKVMQSFYVLARDTDDMEYCEYYDFYKYREERVKKYIEYRSQVASNKKKKRGLGL